MAITATDVKTLRDRTNLPMMECKAALTEAGGDMEKAVELLRKKFVHARDKFASREAAEGRIAVFVDPARKVGTIVEVRCETPSVIMSEAFVKLSNELAQHIAQANPADVPALLTQEVTKGRTAQDCLTEVIGLIRENMKVHRFHRAEGLCGGYLHHDGSVGVLLVVDGPSADQTVLRDICMHIAARNPIAGKREDIPAATVAKETDIARDQLANDPKNKNKPANIMEMIIQGKLKTFFAENVLLEQPFVKDDTKTVGDLLKGMGVTLNRFIRYRVGEK